MDNSYGIDALKLIVQFARFIIFVKTENNGMPGISFRDSSGFLGREEDYKSRIAEEARKELRLSDWSESWIGTGKIAECACRAMNKSENLVNKNQQMDFRDRLDPQHSKYRKEAERVLYGIYRNPRYEEAVAFANAIEVFGAKYDTVAFLFFIKDDSRFLPISTGHFDKGFEILGIDYSTSRRCSWENYLGFNSIIKEIRDQMEVLLPMEGTPRLIDSHSFVWVIQQDRFTEWMPDEEQSVQIEQMVEDFLHQEVSGSGEKKIGMRSVFRRSAEVVKATRKRAHGICQYCHQPAPFTDKKGNPYLEAHHIIWLSRGGVDSTSNTAALCPNCHKRMHILDNPEDVESLQKIISKTQ